MSAGFCIAVTGISFSVFLVALGWGKETASVIFLLSLGCCVLFILGACIFGPAVPLANGSPLTMRQGNRADLIHISPPMLLAFALFALGWRFGGPYFVGLSIAAVAALLAALSLFVFRIIKAGPV